MLNNLKKYQILYISGNFGRLFKTGQDKVVFFENFLNNYILKFNRDITILFPTHTWSLKYNKKFDITLSKSESGVFTEWLRSKNSLRQIHPLGSLSAIGPLKSELIIKKISDSLYGKDTPFDRIHNFKAYAISVGLPPNKTSTIVHYLEEKNQVDYRYYKDFQFDIYNNGEFLFNKFFKLYVWDRNRVIKRNNNLKIFNKFTDQEDVEFSTFGKSIMYGYDLNKFSEIIAYEMNKDNYIWLD